MTTAASPRPAAPDTAAFPLVSVCVPTHNDADHLGATLASLCAQTYPHLEILVSDDASTDATPDVVAAVDDARVVYTRHEANIGQFPNVNSLLERARGAYVTVYHSDDLYEPDIVEREVAFLEAHPEVGAVFALDVRIDAEGRRLGVTALPPDVPANLPLTLADLVPALMRHKNRVLRAPTVMMRREVVDAVGGFSSDYDIAGDFEMWLRVLTRYPVAILDRHLLHYRHDGSQVSAVYERRRTGEEHYFAVMDRYLPLVVDAVTPRDRTEYAFHRADDETFRAGNLVLQGDPEAARALLRRPFPWATFATPLRRRRKLRTVLLRALLRAGLALRLHGPLARVIERVEYGR